MRSLLRRRPPCTLRSSTRCTSLTTAHPEALLDTDMLSLFGRRHPQVLTKAAPYLQVYGIFTFSELTRYEVIRGLRAAGATTRLATFEQLCAQSRVLALDEACVRHAAEVWVHLRR